MSTRAGIGFTMAIFIAGLAFDGSQLLSSAKLAVLVASGVAAVAGLIAGKLVLSAAPVAGAATCADDAEAAIER
jgi:NhaA family Na+:H+ antiporter